MDDLSDEGVSDPEHAAPVAGAATPVEVDALPGLSDDSAPSSDDDSSMSVVGAEEPFQLDPDHSRLLGQVGDASLKKKLKQAFSRDAQRTNRDLFVLRARDDAIAKQWGQRRLRGGDHLAPLGDSMPPQRRRRMNESFRRRGVDELETTEEQGAYPDRWSPGGTLELAFNSIGGNVATLSRFSKRELDAMSVVAIAARREQADNVKSFKLDLVVNPEHRPPWIRIERGWDLQSINVRFGILADLARPVAKYWWYDVAKNDTDQLRAPSEGTWRQLTFEEYKRRIMTYSRRKNRSWVDSVSKGLLHLLAQQIAISMPTAGPAKVKTQHLNIAPIWCGSKDAQHLFTMLESSVPDFDWQHLLEVAKLGILVAVTLHGDMDSANIRHKFELEAKAREYHKTIGDGAPIIFVDADCATHIFQTIIEHAFGTPKLVARLHATTHVANTELERLLHSLREVVSEDLHNGGFHPGARAPTAYRDINEQICQLTLLRSRWTRGRTEVESPWFNPELEALVKALVRDIPCDWSKPRLHVYARKNLDIQSWVDRITSLLSKAIMEPLGSKEAAANKWWTIAPTLENQSLGQFICEVLPRSVAKARIGQHDQDHLDAMARQNPTLFYKAWSGAKAKQSYEFLTDQPSSKHTCACMLVHAEPLDHVSNRLQHLDSAKDDSRGAAKENLKEGGLLDQCQSQLWYNMRHPEHTVVPPARSAWPRAAFFSFFRESPWFPHFAEEWHRSGMKVGASAWSRFEVPNENPPRRWLKQAVVLGVARAFEGLHDVHPCCLDQCVSEPLRLRYPTVEALPADVLDSLVEHLVNMLQETNMTRENLLSFFKSAGRGRSQRRPLVERYTYAAELAVLLKDHMDRGNENPLVETRSEIIAAGVPVKARFTGKQKRGTAGLPSRGDVVWRNVKVAEWQREHPGESVSAYHRRLSDVWAAMSEAEQNAAVRAVMRGSEPHPDEGDDVEEPAEDVPRWSGRDGRWPVAPETVSSVQGAGLRGGVCQKFQSLRWRNRSRMLVTETLDFPEGEIEHKFACWEASKQKQININSI